MSRSDKGDRPRKRFLYPLGRGASFFLLIYARRKLQPSLGNQKSSHLTAGSFYASGTLPRSKNRPPDCFCPAGRTAGLRLAVTASACAPWAGLVLCDRCACSDSLVSAAGGGRLHSKPFSSPMVHKRQFPQKQAIKKYPAASCEVFCGAPCGSKPEHFCVSGRHRHHTAAHPEVMPVVPPREDKRGMLK